MSTTAAPKLDGWKEIAAFLGRDVTTAIRWESERGLPVHRVPGSKRGAVYAYPAEIDVWLRNGQPDPRGEPGEPISEPAAPSGGAAASANRGVRRVIDGLGPPWIVGVGAGLSVILVVGGLWGRGEGSRRRALVGGQPPATRVVASVDFRERELVAVDAAGREVWRFATDAPIASGWNVLRQGPRYAIADLDDDGLDEVVVSVTRNAAPEMRDELLCLSQSGEIRWRVQLDDVVEFRGGRFGPPWSMGYVVAFRSKGGSRIAWSQNSPPSWPSLLVVLDGSGRRVSTFVHSGSIYALAAMSDGPQPLILAGGVSNSNRAADLFVLDGRSASGHSREPPGSAYECLRCPPGRPLRYLVFPPSEISVALGRPYNILHSVALAPEGVHVRTLEGETATNVSSYQHFDLSSSFELENSYLDDNSWPAHELLERQKKLSHSVAECGLFRRSQGVRSWDPVLDWRTLEARSRRPVTVGPRAADSP